MVTRNLLVKQAGTKPPEMERVRASTLYFNRMSSYFVEKDMEEIRTAYAFSKYGHKTQTRNDGSRYFDHPKAVSLIIFDDFQIRFDWRVIVIALLHDIPEDQHMITERRIDINFKKLVAYGIKFVTKDEHSRSIFFERLRACGMWRPMIVKLADRIHNLRTLDTSEDEEDKPKILANKKRQVKETREEYFSLCDAAEKATPKKFRHAIAYARKELDRLCTMYEGEFTRVE